MFILTIYFNLLFLEVGDSSWRSSFKFTRIVDNVIHVLPLALDILLEVRVVGDHLADWLAA